MFSKVKSHLQKEPLEKKLKLGYIIVRSKA